MPRPVGDWNFLTIPTKFFILLKKLNYFLTSLFMSLMPVIILVLPFLVVSGILGLFIFKGSIKQLSVLTFFILGLKV